MHEERVVFEGQSAKGLPLLLRYPISSDVEAMRDFINTLSRERTFIVFQGEQLSLEEEQQYVARKLEQIARNEAIQLLAFSEEKLIGSSDITLSSGVDAHVGAFGLVIADGFRGQGIGKLLMESVVSEAIANLPRLKIITLGVFGNNAIAIDLYEKLGFTEYGRLPGAVLHREQFVDHVYMYRNIER
jgi:RimJ/RimL family protein N-acetyltransferase